MLRSIVVRDEDCYLSYHIIMIIARIIKHCHLRTSKKRPSEVEIAHISFTTQKPIVALTVFMQNDTKCLGSH